MPNIDPNEDIAQVDVAPVKVKKSRKKLVTAFNVSRYSLSGKLLETYSNAKVAAEALNTSQQYISIAARNTGKVLTA